MPSRLTVRKNDGANKNLLLTGVPGVGKTTVVLKVAKLLTGKRVTGFYTEEIREAGVRKGFEVVTLDGQKGPLSHVSFHGPHRVGKYGVDVKGFEATVLPLLAEAGLSGTIVIVDEIGKMECFSTRFVEAVRALLDSPARVVATIAKQGSGFIHEVKQRGDVTPFEVTRQNRDTLAQELAAMVS